MPHEIGLVLAHFWFATAGGTLVRVTVLLALVYAAGGGALALCGHFIARRNGSFQLRDGGYLALALGPSIVLLLTWLLRVAHVYRYETIVGSLIAVAIGGFAANPAARARLRRPWRHLSPLFWSYLGTCVVFLTCVSATAYPLVKSTAIYLLSGFSLFSSAPIERVPHFGVMFTEPFSYQNHTLYAVMGLLSYGDHLLYYAIGQYWINVLLTPALPIGAFLLFRRFLSPVWSIAAAVAFCLTVVGTKAWSLRGESFAWIIAFGMLILVDDLVNARGEEGRNAWRAAPLVAVLFLGAYLSHVGTLAVASMFAFADAAWVTLRDRRFAQIASITLAVAVSATVLVLGISKTYVPSAPAAERAYTPVAGDYDAAIEIDNAWDGTGSLDDGAPPVLARPPYAPVQEIVAATALLPPASWFAAPLDEIPLAGFPQTLGWRLATIPLPVKALLVLLLAAAFVFNLTPAARRASPGARALFWISLAIYAFIIGFALYLDTRSVSLYPLAAIRRSFVYSGFFYWLALGVALIEIASVVQLRVPVPRVLRLAERVAVVTFAPIWLMLTICSFLVYKPTPAWIATHVFRRIESLVTGPVHAIVGDAVKKDTPMFDAMLFIRDHTSSGEFVASNVVSTETTFPFLTNGTFSLLEGESIYQMYRVQKEAAQRIDRFAEFDMSGDPDLVNAYGTRYVILYKGTKCDDLCYGSTVLPTNYPLFERTHAVSLVFENAAYRIYRITGKAAPPESSAIAEHLRRCKNIGLSPDARIDACAALPGFPPNPSLFLARGEAELQQHRYDLATRDFSRSIDADPWNSRAYYDGSLVALAEGNVYPAFEGLTESLRYDAYFSPARELLSSLRRARPNELQAFEYQRNCENLQLAPDLRESNCRQLIATAQKIRKAKPVEAEAFDEPVADAWVLRGEIAVDRGETAAAAADFRTALSLRSPRAYYDLGQLAQSSGDIAGAIKDYDSAIRLGSADANTYLWRGIWLAREGKNTPAMRDMNHALHLNPTYAAAYYWRAQVEKATGNRKLAIRDLHTALSLNPNNAQAKADLALIDGGR